MNDRRNLFWLPFLAVTVSALLTSGTGLNGLSVSYAAGQWGTLRGPLPRFAGEPVTDEFMETALASLSSDQAPSATNAGAIVWDRMREGFGFALPDQRPKVVQSYINRFGRYPRHVRQAIERGTPYLFHILNRVEERGLPAELALLPVVESAFDPFAVSPAGAAGIWQFMPDTAAHFGLDQSWWYDGRRDVVDATEAALDYLTELHARFDGDWLLALAAYNAGSAKVRKAIRANRADGKPADFWHLNLPRETRDYIPKLIALRTVIEQPQKYNILLPDIPDTRYFTAVDTGGQIDLLVASRLAGVPVEELQRLNPGLNRLVTPPDRPHTLIVPSESEHVFRERLAALPEDERITSIEHRIRWGDTLSTIAQHYRTSVKKLREFNRLQGTEIIAGDVL
jgi:membrane-bound lytic murein transglycosylase D